MSKSVFKILNTVGQERSAPGQDTGSLDIVLIKAAGQS